MSQEDNSAREKKLNSALKKLILLNVLLVVAIVISGFVLPWLQSFSYLLLMLLILALILASCAQFIISVAALFKSRKCFIDSLAVIVSAFFFIASVAIISLTPWRMLVPGNLSSSILGFAVILCAWVLLVAAVVRLRKSGTSLIYSIGVATAPFLALFGLGVLFIGSAWGRPLRIRGRQLHPDLRIGSDWTRGKRPDPSSLDEPTRYALEALWLHDAQKEHASVPAFSRIAWLLAAVGAPAELMEGAHRAALEEIEHTRLCFALAAGYAGRSFSVEAMPDLLMGGLDIKDDPIAVLAAESLADGCQLEDFNADVAAACAAVCEEPVTRAVLEQIAREECSHAEFSWALLVWTLARSPEKVRQAVEKALVKLDSYRRPTAVSWDKKHLVDKADQEQMLKHGRLPDERWGELWNIRLVQTKHRLQNILKDNEVNASYLEG